MPEAVLAILRLVFLLILYLFLARVVRAVWVEVDGETRTANQQATPAPEPVVAATKKASKRKRSGYSIKIVSPAVPGQQSFSVLAEMTIGRASGCAISIEDEFASQLHARIFVQNDDVYVEDIGSTNGTYLNRKRVHGPLRVKRGDRIKVGNTIFELTR